MPSQSHEAGLDDYSMTNPTRHYNPTEDKPHPMAKEVRDLEDKIPALYAKYKDSRQRIFKFENGYGASAIQGPFSWYGEQHPSAWEVCPLDYRTDPNGSRSAMISAS